MQSVEWLDLVNKQDEVVGQVTQDDAWSRRIPVRGVNAFVVNLCGELWIPRRTLHKQRFPGCLDTSVGGHVQRGESYQAAFWRETQEELNLDVAQLEWRDLGYLKPSDGFNIFMHVYELRSDVAPQFNPDDFSGAQWLSPRQLLARIAAGDPAKSDLAPLVRRYYGSYL